MQFILRHIFKEKVNGKSITIGGLAKHKHDLRDFEYRDLGGWFDYQPKQDRIVLPMLDPAKNQTPNNTCVFHSYAACREVSEGVRLSPRSLVAYAKKKGYLRSDGLSSVRDGQQAGLEFGIAEESLVPNDNLDWNTYSNINLTNEIIDNASKHKSKSYFWVRSKNDWLKALEDGNAIHTGFDWYSSYNMTGGLSAPWILPWRKGWKVGGHAVTCRGYCISKGLLQFRTSFGPDWGENGDFYVKMSDIFRENPPAAVSVDLDEEDLASFIAVHEGKDVKTKNNSTIYRIQDGKKRPYLNEESFKASGGNFMCGGSFELVASSFLDLIPDGDPI